MELPVQIPQSVLATAKSKLLPWALLIVLLLIVISGLVGLYFGYHYAKGEYSADKAAMLTAYNTALEESQARRKEQEDKGNLSPLTEVCHRAQHGADLSVLVGIALA